MNCGNADATFGPRVKNECRAFDFTRLFEESFFAIAPSTAFLLLTAARVVSLSKARVVASGGWLRPLKAVQ